MSIKTDELKKKINIREKPLKAELFGSFAEEMAKEMLLHRSDKSKENSPTQVRRFYDELAFWLDKIEMEKDETKRNKVFENYSPYIQMIKAKLSYAYGRKLLSMEFRDIFCGLIKQINSPEALKNAKLFFEAYLGFAKAIEREKAPKDKESEETTGKTAEQTGEANK